MAADIACTTRLIRAMRCDYRDMNVMGSAVASSLYAGHMRRAASSAFLLADTPSRLRRREAATQGAH